MNTNTKLSRLVIMLSIVLVLTLVVGPVSVSKTQAMSTDKVLHFKFNGLFADAFLGGSNSGENGYLNVGVDLDTNAVELDFGYSLPDPTNPDFLIIYQGAGEIPNDAFTITRTSAHLAVTTPASYYVQRCVINIITGLYTCIPIDSIKFDLTWMTNSFYYINEKTDQTETYLGTLTKFKGEFTRIGATVSGTYGGGITSENITVENMNGSLLDSNNKTSYRDITMKTYP